MSITKITIDTQGVIVSRKLDPGERLSLRDKQQVVGGLIQWVPDFAVYEGASAVVYVDEEGLLKGKRINRKATEAWRTVLDASGQPYDEDMATLVGDVLILTSDNPDREAALQELDEA